MELYRLLAQISVFISTIVYADSWQCETLKCVIYPQSLRLWRHHIEVSSKSLKVKAGSSFSITCDGSCVGSRTDPHLRWYGPDKHWIAYEGRENRIHVENSFSRLFQKLHLRKVTASDQGLYTCRGWLGEKHGWDVKSIRLVVEDPSITHEVTTKSVETTQSHEIVKNTKTVTTRKITTERTQGVTTVPPTTKKETTTAQIITQTPSTETGIIYTTPNTTEDGCLPPKFKCGSGECFDSSYVCDSYPDCIDASDEKICASSQVCTEGMQACDDGDGCVSRSQICDGIAQCRDRSDEAPDVCNYLHL